MLKRLSDFSQVIASVAILTGLGLVIWELRQSKEIAYAQIHTAGWVVRAEVETPILGEQFASTLVRVRTGQPLTDADLIMFDSWAYIQWTHLKRNQMMYDQGLYERSVKEFLTQEEVCYLFGHDVGRAWLTTFDDDEITFLLRELVVGCDGLEQYLDRMWKLLPDREKAGT